MSISRCFVAIAAILLCLFVTAHSALATAFTTSYTDGGNWQTLFVQGFQPSLTPSPNPGAAAGDTVFLKSFSFFRSGTSDTASNIQMVILNNIFTNLTGLTTSSGAVVGVSNNTIASTASLNLGDAETFNFNNLPLLYGNKYAAVAANIDGSGNITPVRISALAANYADAGGVDFHPVTNYSTESDFNLATSNFINNGFFSTFSYAGDANFVASLDTVVPEPLSAMSMIAGATMLLASRRRTH